MINHPTWSFFLVLFCWCCSTPVAAQQSTGVPSDSLYRIRVKQATHRSLLIPGWGQAYNRSYWKIPVVYGLIGFSGAQASNYHKQYIRFRDAYRIRVDGDTSTIDEYALTQTNALLKSNRDGFRQGRDTFILLTLGSYLLQLVDAAVDAHLSSFTVGDDLSLQWDVAPARWLGGPGGHSGNAGLGLGNGVGLQLGLVYHF
jgi:hypothetical protein